MKSLILALLLIVIAAAIAAACATATYSWFSFALQAISRAGENPPASVARTLESLVRKQDYANAALVGTSLTLLLRATSLLLNGQFRPVLEEHRVHVLTEMILLASAVAMGGLAVCGACYVFRCQPVGSQDLVVATAIHSVLWGILGALLARRHELLRGDLQAAQPCILAGILWGIVYLCSIVLLLPGEHVERLFSTNPQLVGLWAGGGVACLLIAFTSFGRNSTRSRLIAATVETEQLAVKG